MNHDGQLPAPLLTDSEPAEGLLNRWSRDPGRWRARINITLFFLLTAGVMVAVQILDWPASTNLQVHAGDVSTIDVRAPRPLTYQSEILTQEARARAADAVPRAYDPPQTRVARQQLARANLVLDYIEAVRGDPYASENRKNQWLNAISDFRFSERGASLALSLSHERWAVVSAETKRVLDEAMRTVIREGELQTAQRAVPSRIGFGLNDDEAMLASEIVQGLLRPNTFFNAERTEAARAEAAARVEPIDRTIAAGEIIVRAGDRIDPLDIEALDALGLLRVERTWRNYLAASLLAVLLTGLLVVFISVHLQHFWSDTRTVYILASIFVAFIILAKVMVPMHTIMPYLYPLAAMAMLIGVLVDLPVALMATVQIGILIMVFTRGEVSLLLYPTLGAVAGTLALGGAERLHHFVRAGFWIIVTNLLVMAAFRLPLPGLTDSRGILELTTAALVNGILASSFTLVIFYLLGQVFGLTTSLQLLELSRPTHPLLRQLLLKAPGTYHHTLLVSNMTEEAASAIGADALLARVGSYYHDIGKTVRPYFFIENNTEGINPHDRLDPYTSARIIISHVSDGVELARKYRLPEAMVNFIREHHGATRVEYFYHQACQQHESPSDVDENAFRYPGPRPRSRETAILMLADGCEATVRAMAPRSQEEMVELIRSVINRRLLSGQLDECELTLRDLSQISSAFVRVLQGIHHPRVKYPGEARAEPGATVRPALASGFLRTGSGLPAGSGVQGAEAPGAP